ncbi:MAG TPA: hypothetical protein VGX75_08180, partial [bacterium]|nr:hypothetical protein [bacterium]
IDPPSEASSTRRSASHPAPPQDAPLSPAPQAQKRPEVLRHTGKKAKPDRRAGHREATGGPAPDRAGGAKERAPAEPRRPATPSADDLEGDDAGPDQVESRTGVCRSYFVNHDCWRVPGAYCNTALQVCVIRNCPVYHLHKDALERRFAKKFKHFW